MKRKMNDQAISLVGWIMCIMLLFPACQQEPEPAPEPAPADEILAQAGRIHNELISYYFSNRSGPCTGSREMLEEVVELSWEYLDSNGYLKGDHMETREAILHKFETSYLKSGPEERFSLDTATFILQLSETRRFTPRFLKEIHRILAHAHRDDDREAVREYVNSDFTGVRFGSRRDRAAQQLFTDIFNSSYQFWESYENSDLKSTKLEKSSWVIINDGIGGVLGSIFGPLGSVVVATAFSVGTNEEINRD
jgi:hypothetical protein